MSTSTVPHSFIARRSRFKRTTAEAMRITDDDLAIIRHIAKHRFLRSTHLARLLPHRSYKKLLERLGALYHNGYLDRPRAQLDYYATAGSAPIVYALGNVGALVLAERDGMDPSQVDWTWKNRSVGRLYINHTLLTADLMVTAQQVPRQRAEIRLIDAGTMLAAAPEKTRLASNPFKLTARLNHAGKAVDLSVIPDAVFGLDFTAERKRKYFFVEADRATMPITRSDLNQTSFQRKLLAYLTGGGKANAFGAHFGIGNFRVLTVTTSAERMAGMMTALKDLTGGTGSSQFLFVDRLALSACRNLLSLAWTTGKGEIVTLAD